MSELKPCPFCGGEATSFSEDAGWNYKGENIYRAYAGCFAEDCGIGFELFCEGDNMFDPTVDDTEDGITCKALERMAIEKWNRRANAALERTYYADDLRRAFSDMMNRRANDAD